MNSIVPAANYTLDASESTITLTSPYHIVTEEQIVTIRNITKNQLIYDSANTNRGQISITNGVITFTYNGQMANSDKIQIEVKIMTLEDATLANISFSTIKIKVKHGTAAEWAAANPTLAAGEPGYETDTGIMKIGDGVTAYNSLDYVGTESFSGSEIDTLLTTVNSSNISATHKITRSATLVIAASDSSAKSKAQADYVCGGTDDQNTINTAISALPSSGGNIFLLDGTYLKSNADGIAIPSNTTFEMSRGAILKFVDGITGANPIMLSCSNVENVTIKGGTIDGNHSTSEATGIASVGIQFLSTSLSNVKGVRIKNIGTTDADSGYGIYLNSSSHNTLESCRISGCKRESTVFFRNSDYNTASNIHSSTSLDRAYVIHGASYNIINGCTSYNDALGGIDLRSADGIEATGNVISNNTISGTTDGIKLAGQYNPIVIGNSISCTGAGINIGQSESCVNAIVSDNNVLTASSGIVLGAGNHIIDSNMINDCTSTAGIYVVGGGSRIKNNIVLGGSGATTYGIFVYKSSQISDIKIDGNTISGTPGAGICFYNVANSSASKNYIIGTASTPAANRDAGIAIYGTNDRVLLDGNEIYHNSVQPYGIRVNTNATNVWIKNNLLDLSGTSAAILDNTSNAKITNNIGYITEKTGTATITASATTVDVTHGLAAAPTRVLLSPTTSTAGKQYYVSAKAASTFTITIDSAAEADISFDWQAVI